MPTTTKIDTTLSINAIGGRTDFAGSDVDDISAEEFRFSNEIMSEGVLKPTEAFQTVAGGAGTMEIVVGSGSAKTDYALVEGDISGQGDYLVRLDEVSKTITLSAPDASSDRTDEIYLVVLDDTYDASTFALPVLAVREGDVGGGAPGPDSDWDAYMLLSSVLVPGGSADITEATITDERTTSQLISGVVNVSFFEVDDGIRVNQVDLTDSMTTIATVTLDIPTDWNSWKCVAWSSYVAVEPGSGGSRYSIRLEIDGTAQYEKGDILLNDSGEQDDGAIGDRRTALTTTGARTVELQAHHGVGGDVQIWDIFLYARAIRTS